MKTIKKPVGVMSVAVGRRELKKERPLRDGICQVAPRRWNPKGWKVVLKEVVGICSGNGQNNHFGVGWKMAEMV